MIAQDGETSNASFFDQLFGLDEYEYYDSEVSAQASPHASVGSGTPAVHVGYTLAHYGDVATGGVNRASLGQSGKEEFDDAGMEEYDYQGQDGSESNCDDDQVNGEGDSTTSGAKRRAFGTQARQQREARRQRKEELDRLREDNQRLLEERTENLRKIEQLTGTVKNELGGASLEDLKENEILKEQISLHRQFLLSFHNMVNMAPKENVAKTKIYREGAEQAENIFLGILAESQRPGVWKRALFPSNFTLPQGMKVSVWYRFAESLVGEGDPSQTIRVQDDPLRKPRLHLRFDTAFPSHMISTSELASMLRQLLVDQTAKLRLWGIPNDHIELKPLSEEVEDDEIMLLHHVKKFEPPRKNRDVVFLFDHHKRVMTRSTLAPQKDSSQAVRRRPATKASAGGDMGEPAQSKQRKRGRPSGSKGKKERTLLFGEVEAEVLLRTSTTLLAGAKTKAGERFHRVTAPVIAGGIVFEEAHWASDPDEVEEVSDVEEPEKISYTKSITITSTPKDFSEKLVEEDWSRILSKDGVLQPRFLHHFGLLIVNILKEKRAKSEK